MSENRSIPSINTIVAQTSQPSQPLPVEVFSWAANQAREGSVFVLFIGIAAFWLSKDYLKRAIESYVSVNIEIIKALGMIRETSETMEEFIDYAKPRIDYLYDWVQKRERSSHRDIDDREGDSK